MLKFSYLTVNHETKIYNDGLYLYRHNLFINHAELVSALNSFIMKKTILTVAACMLMVTGLMAKTVTSNDHFISMRLIAKSEISSFCKAIMQGDIDTVKRLIELGEDINQKSLGMTPALFAARYNKAEILEVLIAHGADLTIKSNKGWAIEKYAKLSNANEVLKLLKDNV